MDFLFQIKQPTATITKPTTLLINKYSFDDDFDDDTHDNLHRQNQTNIDCEDDDDDVSESSYRNYVTINFIIIEYMSFSSLLFN
jgi:hypothetical protein